MPRLLINLGEAAAHTAALKPGANSIGRDPANDIAIDHATVSSRHCEIVVKDNAVRVRDLESTNGIFIDGERVSEACLRGDQVLHVGSVEMRIEAPLASRLPAGPGPIASSPRLDAVDAAIAECRNHPGAAAAWRCQQCRALLCHACAREVRRNGKVTRFCPACHGLCESLTQSNAAQVREAGFWEGLPQAFLYPFQGDGLIVLVAGTLFFSAIGILGAVSIILSLGVSGYLIAFMQKILLASAQGEHTLPPWPDLTDIWADVFLPFFQVLGTSLICFGPAMFCRLFVPAELRWLTTVFYLFGGFYFPMALLAVTMKGTVEAVNPVFVVGSLLRIPLDYLVTCLVLALTFGVHMASEPLLRFVPSFLLQSLISYFAALYFLTVEMRVLGLLYLANRRRLGWFN